MSKEEVIEGFKCYAPELARQNDGFSPDTFTTLFGLEQESFWFRSRNNLIQNLFRKFIGTNKAEVCEIGCGTGFVLKGLSEMKNLKLSGSEIYIEGLKYAQQRLPQVEFFQADATELPFTEKYDVIGAFDVLEHITEDVKSMKSIFNALKPGGHLFLTVPQYNWMWSLEDDVACHKRRYSRTELKKKLEESGFEIKFISSFIFTLFPFMAVQRFFGRRKRNKGINVAAQGFSIPPLVNKIFYSLTQLDLAFINRKISLPVGGSLVCVVKKVTK